MLKHLIDKLIELTHSFFKRNDSNGETDLPIETDLSDEADLDGDTDLHKAIRNCSTSNEIEEFIQKVGEDATSVMSKAINNEGKLPFHLIAELKINDEEKTKIKSIILPLTSKHSLKNITEQINVEEVLGRYSLSSDSILYKNLNEACIAANQTRLKIHESSTHPQINSASYSYHDELQNKIFAIGAKNNESLISVLGDNAYRITDMEYNKMEIELPKDIGKKFLINKINSLEENKIGNCAEFSYITLKNLVMRNDYKIYGEVYYIENGDHSFLVIGRDPKSSPFKPETWGPNAVICDAWAGDVYLPSEIQTKLHSYTYISQTQPGDKENKFYNLITSFNPHYHRLSYFFSMNESCLLPLTGLKFNDKKIEKFNYCKSQGRASFFSFKQPEVKEVDAKNTTNTLSL